MQTTFEINHSNVLKKLEEMQIMQLLEEYDPVLTGTIPIDIHVPGSDADIVCYAPNTDQFYNYLQNCFSHYDNFNIYAREIKSKKSVVCSFDTEWFPVEIFGQNTPSKLQDAYQHMIIESRIIDLSPNPEEFRAQIRELKSSGVKTEPAFAQHLNLDSDDPYVALLELVDMPDQQIIETLNW